MYEVFSELVGDVFTHINQVIKEEKQLEGWKVKREDWKTVQLIFGPVRYYRTLMVDHTDQNHYPLDVWLGIRKYQRHSLLVEVKVAELASKATYRDTATILNEWTAVTISHQIVGSLLKRVGSAQAREDEESVLELEEAADLPEGKKVDYFYAEADGIFVRGTEKKKSLEVRHAIMTTKKPLVFGQRSKPLQRIIMPYNKPKSLPIVTVDKAIPQIDSKKLFLNRIIPFSIS